MSITIFLEKNQIFGTHLEPTALRVNVLLMTSIENIVVIGAGVVGLSCAYNLLNSGEKVTLLERGRPGCGQSTRTGGGIRYLHGTQENISMSFLSELFWKNFESEFNVDINYQTTGHLFLTSNRQKSKELCSIDPDSLLDLSALDQKQIKTKWPYLSQLIQKYGVYCPIGGYLNHQKVIDGLVAGFHKLGGKLREGVEVKTISEMDNSKYRITSSEGVIEANIIINCAGAHAGQFSRYSKAEHSFTSRHHELLIVRPEKPFPESCPWLIDIDNQVHTRPDGAGRALVGGFLGNNETTELQGYDFPISEDWKQRVLIAAERSFGLIDWNAEVLEHWGGLYPGTVDYQPIIEEEKPGLFTAAGFSGTGLMHAPAAGLIIKDLVKFGKSEKINLSAFSSQRFETLKSVSEKTGF